MKNLNFEFPTSHATCRRRINYYRPQSAQKISRHNNNLIFLFLSLQSMDNDFFLLRDPRIRCSPHEKLWPIVHITVFSLFRSGLCQRDDPWRIAIASIRFSTGSKRTGTSEAMFWRAFFWFDLTPTVPFHTRRYCRWVVTTIYLLICAFNVRSQRQRQRRGHRIYIFT